MLLCKHDRMNCPHCHASLSREHATSDYQLSATVEESINKMKIEDIRRDFKINFVNQQSAECKNFELQTKLANIKRMVEEMRGKLIDE